MFIDRGRDWDVSKIPCWRQEEIGARRDQVGWTKREEQRKEGRKTILSVEGGVNVSFKITFSICCVLSGTVYKTHPWLGVEKLWIFARIATWHLHVDEASKKSKGAKVEEDEELS